VISRVLAIMGIKHVWITWKNDILSKRLSVRKKRPSLGYHPIPLKSRRGFSTYFDLTDSYPSE
jgi:hypothetical protein